MKTIAYIVRTDHDKPNLWDDLAVAEKDASENPTATIWELKEDRDGNLSTKELER